MKDKIDMDVTLNFTPEMVTDFISSNQYDWIHSDWDKKAEKEILFYDKMDIVKGKVAESNHRMFETTKMGGDVVTIGLYSYKLTNKYQFDYDADRKKLLVTYRLSPEFKNDKKNYDKLGFQVFNEKLEKIYNCDTRKENDREMSLPAYHFEVFKLMKDNPTSTVAKVSNNNYIRSTTLIENP